MTTTPALDRAAEALCLADTDVQVHELSHDYPCVACIEEAETAVSAALHDPADPDWLTRVLGDHRLIGGKCRCGFNPRLDYFRYEQHVADAVRAVILGGA